MDFHGIIEVKALTLLKHQCDHYFTESLLGHLNMDPISHATSMNVDYFNDLVSYNTEMFADPERSIEFINTGFFLIQQDITAVGILYVSNKIVNKNEKIIPMFHIPGTTIWDAEVLLAHYIDREMNKKSLGSCILELGCGTGIPNFVYYYFLFILRTFM